MRFTTAACIGLGLLIPRTLLAEARNPAGEPFCGVAATPVARQSPWWTHAGDHHDPLGALHFAHWEGRFDWREPRPACAWTYCGISLQIYGTGLELDLSGAGAITFYVSVDSVESTPFTTAGSEWSSSDAVTRYRVLSNLTPGVHSIEIHRGPEGFFGPVAFRSAKVSGGWPLPRSARQRRKLEVIGDSISAGYGNLGCEFSAATENGSAAYGPVAGRLTGAEVRVEAVSGIGVALNLDGSTTETMPELWEYSIPYDIGSTYRCEQWRADAVVINLGTNDFNAGIEPAAYVAAYEDFVEEIRACYPRALILCAVNEEADRFSAAIDEVVSDFAEPRVQKLNLNTPNWAGCDGHPDVLAHEVMGVNLAARLGEELGW
jgi:lysophospholipase L1-like esterase